MVLCTSQLMTAGRLKVAFPGINGYTVEYPGLDDDIPWEERHWKDHQCVMNTLENEIIPTYYENKQEWARLMRQAMRISEAYFNSDRMVIEYYNRLYKADCSRCCSNAASDNYLFISAFLQCFLSFY